ncbi:MAG: LamG-like jellyroll fold domain-containing protein, partial [Saprospiraceae bacterium]
PGVKIPYVIFPMNGHNFQAGASTLGVAVGKNGITVTEHGDNLAANIIVYYHPITEWTRVVVTCFSGQIVKLWVNGDLVAGGVLNFTGSNKYASTVIGGNQNNSNAHFFKGKMDDLAIWYYERNPVEIALSTFKHPSKTDPLLAAYFDFDEGSAGQNNTAITQLINQTGNVARNATILNMGRTSNTSNWVSAPLRLCEGCQNELTLDSRFGGLDGSYQAADKITVMANSIWNPSGNVILDAPMVEIKTNVTVPNATLLTIKPDGCN